jgi:hypothetical protein
MTGVDGLRAGQAASQARHRAAKIGSLSGTRGLDSRRKGLTHKFRTEGGSRRSIGREESVRTRQNREMDRKKKQVSFVWWESEAWLHRPGETWLYVPDVCQDQQRQSRFQSKDERIILISAAQSLASGVICVSQLFPNDAMSASRLTWTQHPNAMLLHNTPSEKGFQCHQQHSRSKGLSIIHEGTPPSQPASGIFSPSLSAMTIVLWTL